MDDILIEDIDDEVDIKKDINKNNMKKNKKKKVKKLNIYLFIISIIMVLMILLNTYLIIKYDVLPLKYLIIYLLFVVIIPFLIIFLIIKKKKGYTLKVFLSIIEIIYIVILGFAFYYLNHTFNFLDDFTSNNTYQIKNFYVVTLKSSEFKDIKDLTTESVGYVNQLNSSILDANKKLDEVIDLEFKEYKDYSVLFEDLMNEKIQGVVIPDSHFDSLTESDEELESKVKIIYKFALKEKLESFKKDVNVLKETFNIYISGIDSYGDVNSLTRSDVNILVSINPKTHQILMINIPRDYYVTLHEIGQKDKLTHAGIYGTEMSVKSIEDLLDIEINYYFKVNYGALVKLVDALGGVDVYSKYSFTSSDLRYNFKQGYNHVNGSQALEFVRTRKAFVDGDRVRGENQQAMIQAIIKKACSGAILTKYNDILTSLKGTFTTNISIDKIIDLIKMQLDKMPSWNITSISLNGSDGSEYTYSYPHQKLYVMIPDEKTVVDAKNTLQDVKKGKILDSSYIDNTGSVNTPTISSSNSSNVDSNNSNVSSDIGNSKKNDKKEMSINQNSSANNDSNNQENNEIEQNVIKDDVHEN